MPAQVVKRYVILPNMGSSSDHCHQDHSQQQQQQQQQQQLSTTSSPSSQSPFDMDVIIVGAGPCALALVDRLACQRPDCSLDFSFGFDSTNEKLSKTLDRLLQEEKGQSDKLEPPQKKCMRSESSRHLEGRVCIFERTGRFMGRWEDLFSTLDIPHLRSPHTAHPSCTHTQALLAYAKATDQTDAFTDLKNLRYNGTHRAPSTDLFNGFCRRLWERHGLEKLLRQGTVSRVEPIWRDAEHTSVSHFAVHVQSQKVGGAMGHEVVTEKLSCRAVVMATGTAQCPRIPTWMSEACESGGCFPPHSLRHAWDLPQDMHPSTGTAKLQPGERVLVVGGGLTSAQLALLAVAKGSPRVSLVIRRPLVVQPFDSATMWSDRETRPSALARFHSLPMKERLDVVRGSRRYGSIPLDVIDRLKSAGVRIMANTEVMKLRWDESERSWLVILEDENKNSVIERWQRVWAATGSEVDVNEDPLLSQLQSDCPVCTLGGFPCLTPWLGWSEHCQHLFVLGAYAALSIGPDAYNLMGARMASARAAYIISALLGGQGESDNEEEAGQRKARLQAMRFNFDYKRGRVKGPSLALGMGNTPHFGNGRGPTSTAAAASF